MTRYATPGITNSETDNALFEAMFARFGVSQNQFRELLANGEKIKVTKGVYIVNGGEVNTKVVLIIKGWAIAYKHGRGLTSLSSVTEADLVAPDAEGNFLGEPVCQYVGKLEGDKASHTQHVKDYVLPTRASVIGGSALVDKGVVERQYPNDVVAATNLEYIQWEVDDLNRVIDAPKWRALQASIYYSLYVDLIGTLDRDRAIAMMSKDKTAPKKVRPPTASQLRSLAIFVAVPFFGFGLADNAIMLVCGDFIDSTFGTVLGLSTLAAAGLGNWVSDAVGLGLGDVIEQSAAKLGLSNGNLKPAQEKMPIARWTTTIAKLVGISIGCLAGMTPLLFMNSNKKEFTKEDLELYDTLFAPNGVSTSDFDALMEKATRKKLPALSHMVVGGEYMPKVMLLLRGEALAYAKEDRDRPIHKYLGSFEDFDDAKEGEKADEDKWVSVHGAVIGGSAMVNPTLRKSPYPNDIWSASPVEWVEWDLEDVLEIMKEANPIQASFYSVLYVALVKNLQKDRPVKELEVYRAVLNAVLADGYLDAREAEYLSQTRKQLNISEQSHFEVLADIGWSRQRWELNLTTAHGPPTPQRTVMESVARIENELQSLRQVVHTANVA